MKEKGYKQDIYIFEDENKRMEDIEKVVDSDLYFS